MINRDIEVNDFGRTRDGRDIHLITITNSNGTVMELTDMGASLVSLYVSDRNGEMADVVLGHRSGECYERYNGDLFGTIVGRNANRISGHSFTLNGIRYELADNCRGLNIHSGPFLYGERLWEYEILDNEEGSGIVFSLFMINYGLDASAFIKDNQEIVTKYEAIEYPTVQDYIEAYNYNKKYESARLLATDEVGKNLKKIDDVKMLGKILENAKNAQKD